MTSRTGFSGWWGAASGLLAAAAAMGVAQLFAGFTVPAGSPVIAVGTVVINHTPLAVKDWATSTFGTADKTVLLGGVLVVVFLYAMVVGILAMRWLAVGFAGLAIFAAIGLAAALTRHDATASYAVPTLFGALAGALALGWLIIRARAAAAATAARSAPPAAKPGSTASTGSEAPPGSGTPRSSGGSRSAEDGAREEDDLHDGDAGQDDPDGRLGWVAASRYDAGEPASAAGRTRAGPPVPGRAGTPFTEPAPRRQFLVAAGVTVAAAAVGELGGRSLATRKNVSTAQRTLRIPRATDPAAPLPAGVNLPVPGISPFISPNGQFYRVDTALLVPQVDPAAWQLRIHGMVAREVTVTFDQLIRRPLIENYMTLCCVSNPVGGPYIGNAKWLGASLAALIRSAGPQAGADQLLCTSVDGFTSGTPLSVVLDGRDALVAVAMNGTALPTEHGFPARLVVPGLYGYVSACKWVVDIEVTTFARAQAYWVPLGWSQLGPIKTESRIDVPGNGASLKPGQVPVAGVAWAQHKGVEAVEVRVDKGSWHEATLAAVPGIDTWRQWVWQWPATSGTHLIEARATDKTGYTQTSLVQDVAPNGATGYPAVQVSVS
jgi:DMSO/TMAO reductase YedYZ molybdopterin-dependent catalytic subunit